MSSSFDNRQELLLEHMKDLTQQQYPNMNDGAILTSIFKYMQLFNTFKESKINKTSMAYDQILELNKLHNLIYGSDFNEDDIYNTGSSKALIVDLFKSKYKAIEKIINETDNTSAEILRDLIPLLTVYYYKNRDRKKIINDYLNQIIIPAISGKKLTSFSKEISLDSSSTEAAKQITNALANIATINQPIKEEPTEMSRLIKKGKKDDKDDTEEKDKKRKKQEEEEKKRLQEKDDEIKKLKKELEDTGKKKEEIVATENKEEKVNKSIKEAEDAFKERSELKKEKKKKEQDEKSYKQEVAEQTVQILPNEKDKKKDNKLYAFKMLFDNIDNNQNYKDILKFLNAYDKLNSRKHEDPDEKLKKNVYSSLIDLNKNDKFKKYSLIDNLDIPDNITSDNFITKIDENKKKINKLLNDFLLFNNEEDYYDKEKEETDFIKNKRLDFIDNLFILNTNEKSDIDFKNLNNDESLIDKLTLLYKINFKLYLLSSSEIPNIQELDNFNNDDYEYIVYKKLPNIYKQLYDIYLTLDLIFDNNYNKGKDNLNKYFKYNHYIYNLYNSNLLCTFYKEFIKNLLNYYLCFRYNIISPYKNNVIYLFNIIKYIYKYLNIDNDKTIDIEISRFFYYLNTIELDFITNFDKDIKIFLDFIKDVVDINLKEYKCIDETKFNKELQEIINSFYYDNSSPSLLKLERFKTKKEENLKKFSKEITIALDIISKDYKKYKSKIDDSKYKELLTELYKEKNKKDKIPENDTEIILLLLQDIFFNNVISKFLDFFLNFVNLTLFLIKNNIIFNKLNEYNRILENFVKFLNILYKLSDTSITDVTYTNINSFDIDNLNKIITSIFKKDLKLKEFYNKLLLYLISYCLYHDNDTSSASVGGKKIKGGVNNIDGLKISIIYLIDLFIEKDDKLNIFLKELLIENKYLFYLDIFFSSNFFSKEFSKYDFIINYENLKILNINEKDIFNEKIKLLDKSKISDKYEDIKQKILKILDKNNKKIEILAIDKALLEITRNKEFNIKKKQKELESLKELKNNLIKYIDSQHRDDSVIKENKKKFIINLILSKIFNILFKILENIKENKYVNNTKIKEYVINIDTYITNEITPFISLDDAKYKLTLEYIKFIKKN